jgi:hypothetical protein
MIVPNETEYQKKEMLRSRLKSANEEFISQINSKFFSRTTNKYHLINLWWIEHVYSWSDALEFNEIKVEECHEQFYEAIESDVKMTPTEVENRLRRFMIYLRDHDFFNHEVFKSFGLK